jgi:hypothetical protein
MKTISRQWWCCGKLHFSNLYNPRPWRSGCARCCNIQQPTIDIMAQRETTTDEDGIGNKFKVTRNLQGSTTKNVSTLMSHPSSLANQIVPSSQH